MMTDFCVLLDPGHGAVDPSGKYTTAPSKQFQHTKGTFHKGGWFFEGVFNRAITTRVSAKLRNLGIPHVVVAHEYLDTPLADRVETANWYFKQYKNTVYISTHSNASGVNARGFEVYTTPGKTKSDDVATLLWNNVKALLGTKITYRPDQSDSDPDREANFYVIKNTKMPAILIEHLFFDNYDDATLLMSDEILDLFAEAQVRTCVEWMKVLGV